MESSQTWDQTHIPHTARKTPNPWAMREVQDKKKKNFFFFFFLLKTLHVT